MITSPDPPRAGLRDMFFVLALGAIWGGSYFIIKIAVETVPPPTVAAARVAVAAAATVAVVRLCGHRLPRGWRHWRLYFLVGLLGNALPFTLIGWGEQRIDSSLAAILMSVAPLATLALAQVFVRDEPMTPRRVAGIGLGMAGVAVLVGPAALAGIGDAAARQLAVALGAICFAATNVLARHLPRDVPDMANAAGIQLAATTLWAPVALLVDRPWTLAPGGAGLAAILVLGLIPTALATLLYLAVVRRAGATFVSLVNFLVPLFGVALGWAILGERLAPASAGALALILAGMALARRA